MNAGDLLLCFADMEKKCKIPDITPQKTEGILTPLGTGGWIPAQNRHTASYVFQLDCVAVILDFGTGIARLLEDYEYLFADADTIIGFISHYHPDHTIGLTYLPSFVGDKRLEIYAPGKGVYEKSAREILKDMFTQPRMPGNLEDFLPTTEIRDIPIEGMKAGGLDFKFRVQKKHVHPSVGIRIGKHLAYCTDTESEYETIGFAMGVKLLMHDVWYEEKVPENAISSADLKKTIGNYGRNGHSSNVGAALIAKEARVGELMTIHHNPIHSSTVVSRLAKSARPVANVEMGASEDGVSVNC